MLNDLKRLEIEILTLINDTRNELIKSDYKDNPRYATLLMGQLQGLTMALDKLKELMK